MIRRLLSISFILALTANGWGGVLAFSLCPHRGCVSSAEAKTHPASQTEEAQPEEHSSEDVEHSEHHSQHQSAAGETGEPHTAQAVSATDKHAQFCGHCMGAPQAPARGSQKGAQSQARRVVDVDTPTAARAEVLPGVASFPAITPSQCSPPAPAGRRRHLLISTFLI